MTSTTRAPLSEPGLQAAVLTGSRLFSSVQVVPRTGSTNADLLGRGRSGRRRARFWSPRSKRAAAAGSTAAGTASPVRHLPSRCCCARRPCRLASRGWLPLLTGVAVTAVRAQTGLPVSLKWPNDVLCRGDKLAGILAEQAGDAIVVGIGLNVTATQDELPPGPATSLSLQGAASPDRQLLLAAILHELEHWYLRWAEGPPPGDAAGADCGRSTCAAAAPSAAGAGRAARRRDPGRPGRGVDHSGGCWSAPAAACRRSAPATLSTSGRRCSAVRLAPPGCGIPAGTICDDEVMTSAAGLTEGEHLVLRLHQHWKTVLMPLLTLAATVAGLLVLLRAAVSQRSGPARPGCRGPADRDLLRGRPAAALADDQLRADQPEAAAAGGIMPRTGRISRCPRSVTSRFRRVCSTGCWAAAVWWWSRRASAASWC